MCSPMRFTLPGARTMKSGVCPTNCLLNDRIRLSMREEARCVVAREYTLPRSSVVSTGTDCGARSGVLKPVISRKVFLWRKAQKITPAMKVARTYVHHVMRLSGSPLYILFRDTATCSECEKVLTPFKHFF